MLTVSLSRLDPRVKAQSDYVLSSSETSQTETEATCVSKMHPRLHEKHARRVAMDQLRHIATHGSAADPGRHKPTDGCALREASEGASKGENSGRRSVREEEASLYDLMVKRMGAPDADMPACTMVANAETWAAIRRDAPRCSVHGVDSDEGGNMERKTHDACTCAVNPAMVLHLRRSFGRPRLDVGNHVQWVLDHILGYHAHGKSYSLAYPWLLFWTMQCLTVMCNIGVTAAYVPSERMTRLAVETLEKDGNVLDLARLETEAMQHINYVIGEDDGTRGVGKISAVRLLHDFVIEKLWSEREGGFCGAPGAGAHVLSTYACVLFLSVSGGVHRISEHMRKKLTQFYGRIRVDKHGYEEAVGGMPPARCVESRVGKIKSPRWSMFPACEGGEADVRSTYCAVHVINLLSLDRALLEDIDAYVVACQGVGGGFSAAPGGEPHVGYTFCALAILSMGVGDEGLGASDVEGAIRWVSMLQMTAEGGYCGRPHKLVDACYSFWAGASAVMLSDYKNYDAAHIRRGYDIIEKRWKLKTQVADGNVASDMEEGNAPAERFGDRVTVDGLDVAREAVACMPKWLLGALLSSSGVNAEQLLPDASEALRGDGFTNTAAVVDYILMCCQQKAGGLADKPGVEADMYHTCMATEGMSLCLDAEDGEGTLPSGVPVQACGSIDVIGLSMAAELRDDDAVDGASDMDVMDEGAVPLRRVDPAFRLPPAILRQVKAYFGHFGMTSWEREGYMAA